MWQFIKDTWDRYWNEPGPEMPEYTVVANEIIEHRLALYDLRRKIIKARRWKKKRSHLEAEAEDHRTWLLERGY